MTPVPRPSAQDAHRYDAPYVVVAVPVVGGTADDLAPPLVYRLRRRRPRR